MARTTIPIDYRQFHESISWIALFPMLCNYKLIDFFKWMKFPEAEIRPQFLFFFLQTNDQKRMRKGSVRFEFCSVRSHFLPGGTFSLIPHRNGSRASGHLCRDSWPESKIQKIRIVKITPRIALIAIQLKLWIIARLNEFQIFGRQLSETTTDQVMFFRARSLKDLLD